MENLTPEEIEKRWNSIIRRTKRVAKDRIELRDELECSGRCHHPSIYESARQTDDGYGGWWRVIDYRCNVCGADINKGDLPEWFVPELKNERLCKGGGYV